MNYRDLIFSKISGNKLGPIPFVPRLDLWYKSNRENDTLPDGYKKMSLMDIIEDLNIGYHAVVPDFRDYEDENGDVNLGLGIYGFRNMPYKVDLHNIKKEITRGNGLVSVEYETPYGNVRTAVLFNDTMKKSGATLAHVVEYPIKGIQDFKAVSYIFENAEITRSYNNLSHFRDEIGARGIEVAFNSLSASPMHYIMKELMHIENFFYESADHPEELEELAENLSKYYYKVFDVVADSPAEVVLSGANYDNSITSPPFFKKYVLPSLKRQADILHKKGKFLLTHTDGENRGLLELYLESGFDVADSICPSPMTSLSLKETIDLFDRKITIWGGIPSVSVLENSMTSYEFEKYIDSLFETLDRESRIILSIADTTPPGAKFDRIKKIAERVEEYNRHSIK